MPTPFPSTPGLSPLPATCCTQLPPRPTPPHTEGTPPPPYGGAANPVPTAYAPQLCCGYKSTCAYASIHRRYACLCARPAAALRARRTTHVCAARAQPRPHPARTRLWKCPHTAHPALLLTHPRTRTRTHHKRSQRTHRPPATGTRTPHAHTHAARHALAAPHRPTATPHPVRFRAPQHTHLYAPPPTPPATSRPTLRTATPLTRIGNTAAPRTPTCRAAAPRPGPIAAGPSPWGTACRPGAEGLAAGSPWQRRGGEAGCPGDAESRGRRQVQGLRARTAAAASAGAGAGPPPNPRDRHRPCAVGPRAAPPPPPPFPSLAAPPSRLRWRPQGTARWRPWVGLSFRSGSSAGLGPRTGSPAPVLLRAFPS